MTNEDTWTEIVARKDRYQCERDECTNPKTPGDDYCGSSLCAYIRAGLVERCYLDCMQLKARHPDQGHEEAFHRFEDYDMALNEAMENLLDALDRHTARAADLARPIVKDAS